MSTRDPKFTVRLEPALKMLARNSAYGLAWLARRHDLDKGDLQTWLAEFNGGNKELTEGRIDAVKIEVGAITSGRASAAKSIRFATAPLDKSNIASAGFESSNANFADSFNGGGVQIGAGIQNTPVDGHWVGMKIRRPGFVRWKPLLEKLQADPSLNIGKLCQDHGEVTFSFVSYRRRCFGGGVVSSAQIGAFLAYCEAQIGERAAPAGIETGPARVPDGRKKEFGAKSLSDPPPNRFTDPAGPAGRWEVPDRDLGSAHAGRRIA